MTLGPWTTWESHGFKCLARINNLSPTMTFPVGYVGLPSSHPDYGKHYDNIDVDAHGGLTFAGEWEDQNDHLWYVGFDAGHACDYDYSPFTSSSFNPYSNMNSNKSLDFVIEETEKLAEQLAERKDESKT